MTYIFFYFNQKEKKWNHFNISFKIKQRSGELFIVIVILPTNISQKTLAREKRQKATKLRSGGSHEITFQKEFFRGCTFTDTLHRG